MKFNVGDVVIKKTGGNKMTISFVNSESIYECIWFNNNELFNETFNEDEIITIGEYKRILKGEERDDKISKVLTEKKLNIDISKIDEKIKKILKS